MQLSRAVSQSITVYRTSKAIMTCVTTRGGNDGLSHSLTSGDQWAHP